MAKIDDIIEQITKGFNDPQVSFSTTQVEDQYMEQIKVRRRSTGVTHHKLFVLSIGETGQQLANFYGHHLSDCIKKALEWRGLPTKTKRGTKSSTPPEQQPQS